MLYEFHINQITISFQLVYQPHVFIVDFFQSLKQPVVLTLQLFILHFLLLLVLPPCWICYCLFVRFSHQLYPLLVLPRQPIYHFLQLFYFLSQFEDARNFCQFSPLPGDFVFQLLFVSKEGFGVGGVGLGRWLLGLAAALRSKEADDS